MKPLQLDETEKKYLLPELLPVAEDVVVELDSDYEDGFVYRLCYGGIQGPWAHYVSEAVDGFNAVYAQKKR